MAARTTHWPSSMMCPLSSATAMNSAGKQQAPGGVHPADQRLRTDDALAVQRNDRLVAQGELILGQGRTEFRGDLQPTSGRMMHLRPEHLDIAPPLALAAYIAVSASRSRVSALCPRSPKHSPMLAPGPHLTDRRPERALQLLAARARRPAARRPRPRPASGWRTRRRPAGRPCRCPARHRSAAARPRPGSDRRRRARGCR